MAQVGKVECPKMFLLDLFLREKLPVGEGEERICPKVPAYVRRSQFRLPNRAQVGNILHFYFQLCLQTPVIMIGPGTGLAPFRGFIQVCLLFIFGGYVDIVRTCAFRSVLGRRRTARQLDRPFFSSAAGTRTRTTSTGWSKGLIAENLVTFFACYFSSLAREELEAWEQDGLLTLHTAFSRDQVDLGDPSPVFFYISCQAEKRYVTHCLREQGSEVWKLLDQGAHLYVCGDAKMMAKVRPVEEQGTEII